jgi:hypothetical protein
MGAVFRSLRVTRLPDGWAGTADWLFWDESPPRAFVLGDMKTITGDGIPGSRRTGPSTELSSTG